MYVYTFIHIYIYLYIYIYMFIIFRPPIFSSISDPDEASLFRPPEIPVEVYKKALSKLNEFLMNGGEYIGNLHI
jgi:hypothetical protein